MATAATEHSNPYQRAKGIWNERYLHLVRGKWNWQLIAFGLLAVVIVFAAALAWLASQSQVVPYIVRVDKAGQALVLGAAEGASVSDPRVVGSQLNTYIRRVRQVTADRTAQKNILQQAYTQTAGPAVDFLNRYFRDEKTDPFVRNRTHIVMPDVLNTLQLGESTWQVEWIEHQWTLEGKATGEETWVGQFEVAIAPPTEAEQLVANPLGFTVTRIAWSRKF